jgi:hypothetical protein
MSKASATSAIQVAETKSIYEQLASINVNDHIEKKNGLSYLSWAWAVDQLLRKDAQATWSYTHDTEHGNRPYIQVGETAMVFCTVKAFGIERTAQLPVMDYKNKAITNPDAFAVNTAMQRALAKAIALHGIGLYIYAGEDIPLEYYDLSAIKSSSDKSKATKPTPSYADQNDVQAIQALANSVGVSTEKIVDAYKIESLSKLTKDQVNATIKKLQEKASVVA